MWKSRTPISKQERSRSGSPPWQGNLAKFELLAGIFACRWFCSEPGHPCAMHHFYMRWILGSLQFPRLLSLENECCSIAPTTRPTKPWPTQFYQSAVFPTQLIQRPQHHVLSNNSLNQHQCIIPTNVDHNVIIRHTSSRCNVHFRQTAMPMASKSNPSAGRHEEESPNNSTTSSSNRWREVRRSRCSFCCATMWRPSMRHMGLPQPLPLNL